MTVEEKLDGSLNWLETEAARLRYHLSDEGASLAADLIHEYVQDARTELIALEQWVTEARTGEVALQ